MKKLVLLVVGLLICGNAFARGGTISLTSNASPAIVAVSAASPTQEITFPITVRNVTVFNYDSNDGLWINWRGSDTDGINNNSKRFFLGPDSVVSLSDFQTPAITIVYDTMFGSGEASPVSVIATY